MNTTKQAQLRESLRRDPEFRKEFTRDLDVAIAFQIRALRERQHLTQTQLAELLGGKSKQPLVSGWENPNYGKYTMETLKDLANAFDVGLLVRFVPFNSLIDWAINLTPDNIAPPSFAEEEKIIAQAGASTTHGHPDAQIIQFVTIADATLEKPEKKHEPITHGQNWDTSAGEGMEASVATS